MAGDRTRALLAAVAAGGVLAYGLGGHALPQPGGHDGMAGAAMGLCLLLFTAVGSVTVRSPGPALPALAAAAVPVRARARTQPPVDARARASPPVLQRFRN